MARHRDPLLPAHSDTHAEGLSRRWSLPGAATPRAFLRHGGCYQWWPVTGAAHLPLAGRWHPGQCTRNCSTVLTRPLLLLPPSHIITREPGTAIVHNGTMSTWLQQLQRYWNMDNICGAEQTINMTRSEQWSSFANSGGARELSKFVSLSLIGLLASAVVTSRSSKVTCAMLCSS